MLAGPSCYTWQYLPNNFCLNVWRCVKCVLCDHVRAYVCVRACVRADMVAGVSVCFNTSGEWKKGKKRKGKGETPNARYIKKRITVPNKPEPSAIMPPVLHPTIKSKRSRIGHCANSSIFFSMTNVKMPFKPPPSKTRIFFFFRTSGVGSKTVGATP